MKKFFHFILMAVAFALSGCSDVNSYIKEEVSKTASNMTYVLPAGFKIKDDSRTILAFGSDTCPVTDSLFGSPSDSGTNTCVVVNPSTDSVIVGLLKNKEFVYEKWDVIRDNPNNGSIMLRRPNGNFVISEQS